MSKPLVTIAIPTYNRADGYLGQTLGSAVRQTYAPVEILVSDNASTDHTEAVIRSCPDPRVRYFRQDRNLGQRGNMNFLLDQAGGDYFLMLHDDDEIDPDFVEACVEAAGYREGPGLIVTGSRVMDGAGTVLREKENRAQGLSAEDFIVHWYRKKVHLFLASSLFGTRALREAGGFEARYGHYDDVAAGFKCASSHGRVDVREVKAGFREHPGSGTSASDLESWCESALALLDLAVELAPSRRDELLDVGARVSADRVYRYAAEADSSLARLRGYWTVCRSFGYRRWPRWKHWCEAAPFLRHLKRADPRQRLVAR